MNDYERIINTFIHVAKGESIAQIGPPFLFYHSDESNSHILVNDVFSIDIKSAFPTICKILFGIDSKFVKHIYSIENKLEKNIFISTTLKNWSSQTNINYLSELNILSKLLIFNYVYTKFSNITILEYAKDGMYITGEFNNNYDEYQSDFLNIVDKYDIKFHLDKIDTYLRFNKTSIYKTQNNIQVKGKYKGLPNGLIDILSKLLSGNVYNSELLNLIRKLYSKLYFNVLLNGQVSDEIKYLYQFDTKKYLLSSGEFTDSILSVTPHSYLYLILYPVLNLLRLNLNMK